MVNDISKTDSVQACNKLDELKSVGVEFWLAGDYHKAEEYFQDYLTLAQTHKDEYAEVQACNLLGNAYWSLSDYKRSLFYFLELLRLASARSGDSESNYRYQDEVIRAKNNLGNLYISLGNYEKALDYFLKALKLLPESANKEAEAKILNNIGIVYNYLESYQDAWDYHHKSLKIRTEINDRIGIAHSLNNIGLVCQEMKDYDKALEYLEKSNKLKEETGDKNGMANTLNNIGTIYMNLNKWDIALEYTEKSLQLYQEEDCRFGVASSLTQIARILINQHKYEEARDYLQKSEVIASEITAKTIQRDNLNEYYQLEKELHNYPAALEYCEKYNALKEEIFNEENARKTSEMKISFELDQKEKETEIYRKRSIELTKANTELERLKDNLELRVQTGIEENRKKDSMMIAQSRLATMGQMISFIAHQWKQPLNAISVITQNTEDAWQFEELNDEKLHYNSTQILDQIKFMADTIEDFRNFFRPDIEKSDFYPGKIIRKTIRFIEKNFQENEIEIELDLNEKCLVKGMPNELSQVVLNILNNARDAFIEKKSNPKQRKVKITLSCSEDQSIITFRDNAGGIPENVLPRIFESYFSTKGNEQGTGLGLSMCKTIIEGRMHGKLTAENIDNGVEFRIIF